MGWPARLPSPGSIGSGELGVFWAAHQSDLSYSQIERLVNLSSLPPFGFKVACFPLKVQGGSSGPARVVALLPD